MHFYENKIIFEIEKIKLLITFGLLSTILIVKDPARYVQCNLSCQLVLLADNR